MLEIDDHLTLAALEEVSRRGRRVSLAPAARERVARNRAFVDDLLARGETVYGLTTGFGRFASTRIDDGQVRQLQRNLILSHAVGVGEPFPTEVVRGMLLLRAQSLALGASGVRPVVVERLLDLLNAGVHPVVPSQGSVGASGDLAPLAHVALTLIGEGEAELGGGHGHFFFAASEAYGHAGVAAHQQHSADAAHVTQYLGEGLAFRYDHGVPS